MCGIAGFINLDGAPASKEILQLMTDAIAHRGPDGEGHWCGQMVGLGHRRLAIIDRSSFGSQPMVSQNGRYILTYNGEIYNYKEIRQKLRSQGYSFNGESDTEVVLTALQHWGTSAIPMFNGMFALAFYDEKEKKLLLARDRYGIKPLYYSIQKKSFRFASEQKSIFADSHFSRNLNKEALLEYFTFQNIFSDQTLLKDISILPPGHFAQLTLKRGSSPNFDITQYWDFNFNDPKEKIDEAESVEEFNRLFTEAVNRQLVGDVEVGAYLSGGIDSGSITSVAAEELSYIKTFTCGFDMSSASGIELTFDERVRAEALSAFFKTEHYQTVLKAGDMERCLPSLAWHLEEPRVGQSYPNYYAAKLASRFVKVVLSGTGGDELFGGYPWRYYQSAASGNSENYIAEYYKTWQRLLPNVDIQKAFLPIWPDVKDVWTQEVFRNVFSSFDTNETSPEYFINQSLYFEAKTFLHGLLIVEDKLSMAHGLENRVPFLDNDLVDFAMSCPISQKLNDIHNLQDLDENLAGNKRERFFKKTNDGKQLLRKAMAKKIPKEILSLPKQGFSSPDASWFRGESIEFVKKKLFYDDAVIFEFLDRSTIHRLVEEHLNGVKNRRLLIWSLLNVNEWVEQTIG